MNPEKMMKTPQRKGKNLMEQKERIEMLVKLYCYYMTDVHKLTRELHKASTEVEFTLAIANLNRCYGSYINPILEMLYDEGVQCMKAEDDKIKVLLTNHEDIVVDDEMYNPFRIDFPTKTVYTIDGREEQIW